MIQLSRAPIRNTTSAFCSAWLRAAPTDNGWVSGITPLPIGEARNGSLARSMKARTSFSAREYAMPLPMMTSGRSADRSTSSARSTSCGPAVLRRVGEAGEGVDDAGARHEQAGAGAASQIADRLRGIRGGLLVAHADVGDPFSLRGRGDRLHRKPDDPEHELDTLLLEIPRD